MRIRRKCYGGICAAAVLLCLWLVLGIAARRDISSLMILSNPRSLQHRAIEYDDFVFGVSFNPSEKEMPSGVVWLSETDCVKLRQLLPHAKLGSCMSDERFFMGGDCRQGGFYLVPNWCHRLGLKYLLFPLMHRIEMFYWPSKKLLYLSEDREELSYDFSRGLNVTNVLPENLDCSVER